MDNLPLGETESDVLEFKGRDVLNNRRIVGRAIVALLNSRGGEVWVGIREERGRAASLEPIPDLDRQRDTLVDYLVDTIEPSPAAGEIRIDKVSAEEGDILRVTVREGAHGPYAHLGTAGGRYFLSRFASRTRPMTRAELRKAFRESEEPHGPREEVKQRILGVREQLQKAGNDRFWMQMAPLKPLEVDPQSEELRELLEEPEATGNRRAGWIVVGRGLAELRKRRLVLVWPPPQWGDEGKYRQETEIRADGTITYSAPLEVLFWSPSTDPTREEETKQIWPFALLELPVSFMRLASRVYEGRLTDEDLLLADLALLSLQGVVLRPSSPSAPWRSGRIRYDYFTDRQEYPEDDFTLVEPLELTFAEVSREPDRCAFRLVRLVYEAFGFGEEAIPVEFDRRAGRLMLSQ